MTRLANYLQHDARVDRLAPDQLRELQNQRLRDMVRYCYDEAPFWRRKFDAAGVSPDDIETIDDIVHVPFCTKQELQEDQEAHPPFGSYVAIGPTEYYKYFGTSGTTGKPLRRVYSKRDWDNILDRFTRNPGVKPGDVVLNLGPIDGLMGPTAGVEANFKLGAMVVLAGLYDTKTKIELIRDLRPTTVHGTASYLTYLLEVSKEMGIDLAQCGIKRIASVGEPGAAVPETRKILTEGWNAHVGDGFGMTELFPLGGGCAHSTALHISADIVLTEIIDPKTGKQVPPGTPGEVVYTNLVGDTQPLLRYRSKDIARIDPDIPCACGFTGALLKNSIEGRVDDMIWYRGNNVYPNAIESAVRGLEELTPEYQIVVGGNKKLPTLTVKVEARADVSGAGLEALRDKVTEALVNAIRVRPEVEVLEAGSLPRADGRKKIRRVVYENK